MMNYNESPGAIGKITAYVPIHSERAFTGNENNNRPLVINPCSVKGTNVIPPSITHRSREIQNKGTLAISPGVGEL